MNEVDSDRKQDRVGRRFARHGEESMLDYIEPYIGPLRDWLLTLFRYSWSPAAFSQTFFEQDRSTRVKQSRTFAIASVGIAGTLGLVGFYLLPAGIRDPASAPNIPRLADWKTVTLMLLTGFLILPTALPFALKRFIWTDAMSLYAFAFGAYVVGNALLVAAFTCVFEISISNSNHLLACLKTPPVDIGLPSDIASLCWGNEEFDMMSTLADRYGWLWFAFTFGYPVPVTVWCASILSRALGERLALRPTGVLWMTCVMLGWIWFLQLGLLTIQNWTGIQMIAFQREGWRIPEFADMPSEFLTAVGHRPPGYIEYKIRKDRENYCDFTPFLLQFENNPRKALLESRRDWISRSPHIFDGHFACAGEDRWINDAVANHLGAADEGDRGQYDQFPPLPE